MRDLPTSKGDEEHVSPVLIADMQTVCKEIRTAVRQLADACVRV